MLILAVTIVLNVVLFYYVPKGFLPSEDTGELFGVIQADQSISFQSMEKKFTQFVNTIAKDKAVQNVTGFTGGGGGGPRGGSVNSGQVFVQLVPENQRNVSTDQVDQASAQRTFDARRSAPFPARRAGLSAQAAVRATRNINTPCRQTRSTNSTRMAAKDHRSTAGRPRTRQM